MLVRPPRDGHGQDSTRVCQPARYTRRVLRIRWANLFDLQIFVKWKMLASTDSRSDLNQLHRRQEYDWATHAIAAIVNENIAAEGFREPADKLETYRCLAPLSLIMTPSWNA